MPSFERINRSRVKLTMPTFSLQQFLKQSLGASTCPPECRDFPAETKVCFTLLSTTWL